MCFLCARLRTAGRGSGCLPACGKSGAQVMTSIRNGCFRDSPNILLKKNALAPAPSDLLFCFIPTLLYRELGLIILLCLFYKRYAVGFCSEGVEALAVDV